MFMIGTKQILGLPSAVRAWIVPPASESFLLPHPVNSMNKKNCFAWLVGFFALTLGSVVSVGAQSPATGASLQQGTGSITGRVQNVISGQYLINARLSIKGTQQQTFTDELGVYHLMEVPSGPVVLQVFYTGLDSQEIAVDVPAGGRVVEEIFLSPADRYGENSKTVKLDPFVVAASGELSAEALAVNEQRFAANIKNVLAADAFGDISEGNIGEFMKYMPGITADFADPDIVSLSVRGLASNLTQVTSDGAQMASAHTGGATRVFQFNQVSINNISRLELTKVPTPANPADSLGGIINLVSKSAFERKSARLDYRVFMTGEHGNLTTKRKDDGFDDLRYRILPSADFTYTIPVNNKLGFVISGLKSYRFDDRQVMARTYNATLANSGASYSQPFLQSITLQNMPRYTDRISGSVKADWRVTPNSVLSVSYQYSGYDSSRSMDQILINVGGNAVPASAGTRLDFGPDYTYGATGRGAMTMNGDAYKIDGQTDFGNVRYRFNNGDWEIKAGASKSSSSTIFTDTESGTFYNSTTQLHGAAGFVGSAFTVNFHDVTPDGGIRVEILDRNNQPVDLGDLKNYRLTAASSQPRNVKDDVATMDVSVRRNLSSFSFPLAIEVGAAQRSQKRSTQPQQITWDYAGLDGVATTNESPLAYLTYGSGPMGFGFSSFPTISGAKLYEAWQDNSVLFSQTEARKVTAEKYRIENSEFIQETVSAGYIQADARFFKNRLRFLTGVRFEETMGKGQGALIEPTGVYVRSTDGSLAHDDKGNLIRKPEAGAVGSLAEVSQTYLERASRAKRSYNGFYPSAHLTYNFTENMLLRVAYAETYGRPNFNQIIPRATVNVFDTDDDDPDAVLGTLNIRNPALRPWSAENYDISLEYYTKTGGMYGVGAFYKELDGFFQSITKVATAEDISALGLDPMYTGYRITTSYNLNKRRTKGIEANFKQSLDRLGPWGRYFDVFANTSYFEQVSGLKGRSINGGVTFRTKRIVAATKFNHRTGARGAAVEALGSDAYQYEGTRTTVDLSLSLAITPRVSLFANGSNIFNDDPTADRYGSETPDYARLVRIQHFGAQYSIGVKGSF